MTIEVPYSWPVALHPDVQLIPRSENVVDAVRDDHVARVLSVNSGLPAVLHRLMREQPLSSFLEANRAEGFLDAASADVLAQLGRGGALRRLAQPGFGAGELRDFEREIGALSRHETAEISRFQLFARVRSAHVVVIGAGLNGANVIQHLAASGVGNITVVDPASIERGQSGRHPWFGRGDVGRSKAERIVEHIAALTPYTRARAVVSSVDSEAGLEALLSDHPRIDALVYTCDRNLDFGVWAARQARARSFALLRVNRIVVGPLYRPEHGDACPGCIYPRLERGIRDLTTVNALGVTARDSTASLWSPELSAFGALAAQELIHCLAGVGRLDTVGQQVGPNPRGAHDVIKPFPRDVACPACGDSC